MCRLVLGSHHCSAGPRRPAGHPRGSLPGAGQQPPSVHADPVGQDGARTHQHPDPVQRRPVPAGLQLRGAGQPLVLPQRPKLGAALHGGGAESGGAEGGGAGGAGEALRAAGPGGVGGAEAEAGRVQTSEPPDSAAPDTPCHQQTQRRRGAAAAPQAAAAFPAGLPLQGVSRSGAELTRFTLEEVETLCSR